jgi:hypothetical protein
MFNSILRRCCCFGLLAVVVALSATGVAQDNEQKATVSGPPSLINRPYQLYGEATVVGAVDSQGPLPLDLSQFYLSENPVAHIILDRFSGRQIIDGLPFQIGGQARLYGQTFFNYDRKQLPNSFKGIRVGCKFDDLYLVHHAMWPDVDGQPIAYIRLNYADGSEFIYAIRYGVHVSDWYLLPSYPKESVTDPNTKICWSRPPVEYNAPVRLFKSKLGNPFPEKMVETMDVVSARSLASYNLIAATVAQRPVKPAGLSTKPPRSFDGALMIRVVDDATGEPIVGALVTPSMNVEGEGVLAPPFFTSSNGEGIVRYPVKLTSNISATVKKEGYRSKSENWGGGLWSSGIPSSFTFRLVPGDENP